MLYRTSSGDCHNLYVTGFLFSFVHLFLLIHQCMHWKNTWVTSIIFLGCLSRLHQHDYYPRKVTKIGFLDSPLRKLNQPLLSEDLFGYIPGISAITMD